MPDLPPDIITVILSRLPVKSLLRFRCVCKPWCAQIDSSKFIKMHLYRSIQTLNNLSLILNSTEPRPYSVDFDSLNRAVELDHPLKSANGLTQSWGSCNGLLCLVQRIMTTTRENVVLWNPATKKKWEVPDSRIESRNFFCIYGFGWDRPTDDYKVVRIVISPRAVDGPNDADVYVYSLKSNSWRRILDFPYYLANAGRPGRLAGGALHWVVTVAPQLPRLIVAFHLGSECFRIVPQPEYMTLSFLNIGVLEDCLCVICHYDWVGSDIWVMKEYGVKESWTKLFSINRSLVRSLRNLKPIAYSKNRGKVLIQHDNTKLSWYDIKRKILEKVKVRDLPDWFMTTVCLGSLVPLWGGGGKEQVAQESTQEKKKQRRGMMSCQKSSRCCCKN